MISGKDGEFGLGKGKYPRCDLSQIISQLENPLVREDNTSYKVDAETLGILYASAVQQVLSGNSPGLMLARYPDLSDTALPEFQKRFQIHTRNFLYQRVGELVLRDKTAAELKNDFFPKDARSDFARNTVESLVAELTKKMMFENIAEKVKAGAQAYHYNLIRRRRQPNYHFALEYNAILNAFL